MSPFLPPRSLQNREGRMIGRIWKYLFAFEEEKILRAHLLQNPNVKAGIILKVACPQVEERYRFEFDRLHDRVITRGECRKRSEKVVIYDQNISIETFDQSIESLEELVRASDFKRKSGAKGTTKFFFFWGNASNIESLTFELPRGATRHNQMAWDIVRNLFRPLSP